MLRLLVTQPSKSKIVWTALTLFSPVALRTDHTVQFQSECSFGLWEQQSSKHKGSDLFPVASDPCSHLLSKTLDSEDFCSILFLATTLSALK